MGAGLKQKGVNVKLAVMSSAAAEENPAGDIIKFANEIHADLIVTSTHVRSYAGHWVFGSVAERLIHRGTIPLLVLKTSPVETGVDSLTRAASFMGSSIALQGGSCG